MGRQRIRTGGQQQSRGLIAFGDRPLELISDRLELSGGVGGLTAKLVAFSVATRHMVMCSRKLAVHVALKVTKAVFEALDLGLIVSHAGLQLAASRLGRLQITTGTL
ncbi:hypothetical protein PRNP1_004765 [Phytophthora ramorum]